MNTKFSLTFEERIAAYNGIRALVHEAGDNAEEHGFHKIYTDLLAAAPVNEKRAMRRTILLAKLALITSEVGEAVGALQHGDDAVFEEEVADIVIRVFDLCETEHIDLGAVIMRKMEHNRKRPYLHGKEC